MQGELIAENAATKIRLLGVNAAGFESGNGTITTSRTLPWLQDTAGAAVWASWAAINRDVIILDTFNIKRDVFNLTLNDLSNATNYAALKARLKLVAGEP